MIVAWRQGTVDADDKEADKSNSMLEKRRKLVVGTYVKASFPMSIIHLYKNMRLKNAMVII